MKSEIDLSKAYAGQIAHLNDSTSIEIQSINPINRNQDEFSVIHKGGLRLYRIDGTYMGSVDNVRDIVSLSDSIQVQCARIEGEIEAYEGILLSKPAAKTFDFIRQKRADAKAKLLTLQNQ